MWSEKDVRLVCDSAAAARRGADELTQRTHARGAAVSVFRANERSMVAAGAGGQGETTQSRAMERALDSVDPATVARAGQ